MAERPYVIFTLRRTGGTSLTAFLTNVSSFPRLQDEPLNPDRAWGDLTRQFRSVKDEVRLAADLTLRVAARPNIKHCVELVPLTVTRALIAACAAKDYAIFILKRRSETDRLMSLALAMATGAWGSRQIKKIYPQIQSGKILAQSVQSAVILHHAMHDPAVMDQTHALMTQQGLTPDWLIFEDIYKGATPPEAHALRIAHQLGITIEAGDPRFAPWRKRQRPRPPEIAALVPGLAELQASLEKISLAKATAP